MVLLLLTSELYFDAGQVTGVLKMSVRVGVWHYKLNDIIS